MSDSVNQFSPADTRDDDQLTQNNRLSNVTGVLPLTSILVLIVIGILFWWMITGEIYRFYASAVFLFYSWTKSMWVSVILLGVFQTLVLVPLRIFRVIRADNIKDMHERVAMLKNPGSQQQALRKSFSLGNKTFLFYLLDFSVQITTFLSIGKLFLTDFYSKPLDPVRLYSWVPYPEYPILDRMFKLPYPVITNTIDLGWKVVVLAWVAILLFQMVLWVGRTFVKYSKGETKIPLAAAVKSQTLSKYSIGYFAVVFWLSWLILSNVPTGLGIRIFSGDVAFQNSSFNTVTAIVTFLTLLWFDVNEISQKKKEARKEKVPDHLIDAMGRVMFRESFFTAAVVGLGAYFITNQIPSAFELSIFALEIIALLSPLTLDKWVQSGMQKKDKPPEEPKEQSPAAKFGSDLMKQMIGSGGPQGLIQQ
jgi:hypothetical protein